MGSFPSAAAELKLPQQQPDMLGEYGKMVQLKSLLAQQQLQQQLAPGQLEEQQQKVQQGKLATEAAQQQQSQTQAINAAYHDALKPDANGVPQIDTEALQKSLASAGHGVAIPSILKSVTDYQKSQADAQEARNKVESASRDSMGLAANAIVQSHFDPNLSDLLIEQGLHNPSITPQGQQQLSQMRGLIQQNPDQFKKIITAMAQQSPATAEAQKAAAEGGLAQHKLDLIQNTKPEQLLSLVDQIVPPTGSSAALNLRTKALVSSSLKQGDIEGAQGAIKQASEQIGTIEKETNPQVVGARVQQAVATQQALNKAGQTAVANVPPHLVSQAISDYNKVGDEYAGAAQAANDMKTFIDLARKGNKVAYAYSPTEGVLTLNTGRGVKRVNMAEIGSYTGAGSTLDRVKAFFGKSMTGASIPAGVLGDMEELHGAIADNAKDLYQRKVTVLNKSYGSTFEPIDFSKAGGESSGTSAPKAQSSSAAKVSVGQVVSIGGRSYKVTALRPDGKFDAVEQK